MAIAKKKKRFFDVDMPLIRKTTQLQAMDIKELDGRYLKYDLTRIMRGKSIMLQMKVEVKDDIATATPRELKVMPYYLRRMVRKGTDYVEDSLSIETRDSIVRVKPLLVTRRRVSRAVLNALREKSKAELTAYFKERTTVELFDEVLKGRLQKELSMKMKKVYPLSLSEIRILKVEKDLELKPVEKKVEEKVESEEKPAKKKVVKKKAVKKEEKVEEVAEAESKDESQKE